MDVVVVRHGRGSAISEIGVSTKTIGLLDYIRSLPPRTRTVDEWALIEREFQEDRDAWDR